MGLRLEKPIFLENTIKFSLNIASRLDKKHQVSWASCVNLTYRRSAIELTSAAAEIHDIGFPDTSVYLSLPQLADRTLGQKYETRVADHAHPQRYSSNRLMYD